jgi:hypothetical protein
LLNCLFFCLFVVCWRKQIYLLLSKPKKLTSLLNWGVFVGSEVPKCQNFKFLQNGSIIHKCACD